MKTRIKTYGLKRFQIIGLLLFLWVAVFHNQICYDKPLEASVKSSSSSFLPPLIPYAASSFDKANRNVGPFDQQQVSSWYYRHWLGTNALGKDVLAGLINGSYIALKVGFWTGLFSLIIGVFFGYLSGYFGDSGLRVNKLTLFLSLILSAVLIFYAVYTVGIIRVACLITIVLVMFLGLSNQRGVRKKLMPIPVDLCVPIILPLASSPSIS